MNKITNTSSSVFNRAISSVAVIAMVASMALPTMTFADTFNRQMQVGTTGTDVRNLQSFLAGDDTLYPQGKVTGYYGFLTKAAVSNFQERNDISPVGRVGPATLPVLNLQYDQGLGGSSEDGSSDDNGSARITSVVVNANKNTATVRWDTSKSAKGVVYYSTSPLTLGEHENSVDVSGSSVRSDTNYHSTQNVLLENLQADTTYHYLVYSTSQDGGVSVTMPATFRTTAN